MRLKTLLMAAVMVAPAASQAAESDRCSVVGRYHEVAAIYKEKGFTEQAAMEAIEASTRRSIAETEARNYIRKVASVAVKQVYALAWYSPVEHERLGTNQCQEHPERYFD